MNLLRKNGMKIVHYIPEHLEHLVELYNQSIQRALYSYPVTVNDFQKGVIECSILPHFNLVVPFDPKGCFIVFSAQGYPLGFVHGGFSSASEVEQIKEIGYEKIPEIDCSKGIIRCIYFDRARPDVGYLLVKTAVSWFFNKALG